MKNKRYKMTDFQKQTLKDVAQTAGIAIGTVSVAFGLIILMAISPYSGFAIVGAFILYLIIRYLIIPLVKDWKLRGKLIENEYSIYRGFQDYLMIGISEQRAKEIICTYHNMTTDELDNILEKAEVIR